MGRRRSIAWACSLVLVSSSNLLAATVNYTNAAGTGLWSDPGNWDTNTVPTATDAVVIPKVATIALGGDRTVASLTLGGETTLSGGIVTTPSIGQTFESTFASAYTIHASFRAPGSSLSISSFGQRPTIDGPILGNNFSVFGSANFQGAVNATGFSSFDGSTLSRGGTLPFVTGIGLNSGNISGAFPSLKIDNSEIALSGRLNPALGIGTTAGRPSQLVMVGNTATATTESVGPLALTGGTTTVAILASAADTHFNVARVTFGTNAVLALVQDSRGGSRLTSTVVPTMVGGTGGGDQTPIVPFAVSLTYDAAQQYAYGSFGSNGFLTYDQTPTPAGGPVGFRPLRADEFAHAADGSTATTNVRLSGDQALSTDVAANSLALDGGATVDLQGHSFNLTSGALWNAADLNAVAPVLRSTIAGGQLTSNRVVEIIPAGASSVLSGRQGPLVIDVPIVAPSLAILGAGGGSVRLQRANSLPGGISLDGGTLQIGNGGATGVGPLTIYHGSVLLDDGVSIPNAVNVQVESAFFAAANDGSASISGPLSGNGVFTYQGNLRLTGGGTFTGVINAPISFFGPVVVASIEFGGTWTAKGTLSVSGTVYGNATIPLDFDGGTISPGSKGSVGAMTIRSLSPGTGLFGGEATLLIEIAGHEADRLVVTGVPLLGGRNSPNLMLSILAQPSLGDTFVIEQNNAPGPLVKFAGLAEGSIVSSGGYQFELSYVGGDGNDATLIVVPEPASTVAAVALVGLFWPRRRTSASAT